MDKKFYKDGNNRLTRRAALSTSAKVAIGAVVAVGAGVGGYFAGLQAAPKEVVRTVTVPGATVTQPGVTSTVTVERTVERTITAPEKRPKEVRVAVFSHYEDVPRKVMAPYFEPRFGVPVVFETVVAAESRDKYIAAHRAGTSPYDSLELWATTVQEMADRGWLVDLTDWVNRMFGPDRGAIADVWEAATYKGRIYAVPDKIGCPILQWNKELLKEAGLDPERPYEWWKTKNSINEFVEYAKATTYEKGGVQYWGYVDQWGYEVVVQYSIFAQMFGGKLMDTTKNQPWGEPAMNQQPAVEALQWMVDLLHKHKCIDPASLTYNWVFDFLPGYLQGNVAMVITWPFVTHVSENPEQSKIVGKTGFAPNFAKETTASVDGTEFFGVSKFAPNGIEAGLLWLEHVTSFDMQRRQGLHGVWAPIYKSLLTDPDITKTMYEAPVIRTSYEYPHSNFWTPDWERWTDILRKEIHAALRLEKTPQQAMDDAARRIKEEREAYTS